MLASVNATSASAQNYPVKPLRFIVGFAPGGGTDFVARIIAQKLTEALGQQVIVENRPGAGGLTGLEFGLRSAPDGYTYTVITPGYGILPSLYPVKYDPLADYTPVLHMARGPLVAVIHPSVPAKTLKDLIAMAKARPGQIVYGSAGQGSIVHLANELFLDMAGLKMVHVPYKGGAPAMTDLIAGQVALVFATPQVSLQQVKAGRLRALAVTTAERLAAEPGIPSMHEAGVPGYDVSNWHALIGPKGVPRALVERLNSEVLKIVRMREVEERLRADGVSPTGSTPEQLHELIRREYEQWKTTIVRAGIRIQ
jgi:tripartite-type tricarboxylate transporter receptor subunit TctC